MSADLCQCSRHYIQGERNAVDMFADLAAKSAFLVGYAIIVIVAFWAVEKVVRRS